MEEILKDLAVAFAGVLFEKAVNKLSEVVKEKTSNKREK